MPFVLDRATGFAALPLEICDIIADILSNSGDTATLSSFSTLERRLVDVANRACYRTVDTAAVKTLALSDVERSHAFDRAWMPTHPAAFVQSLGFTFKLDTIRSEAISRDEARLGAKTQLLDAFNNLVRHARGPEVAGYRAPWLKTLRLVLHGLVFAEVFEGVDPRLFRLKSLALECDFPRNDYQVEGCMKMLDMLNTSTTTLLLNIDFRASQRIGQVDPVHSTQRLLRNVPQLAPNLRKLSLALPIWASPDSLHPLTVFFSGLRFPNLRAFSLYSGTNSTPRGGNTTIDLVPFFMLNPKIVDIDLNGHFGLGSTHESCNDQLPKALLELNHFCGTFPNCMAICGLNDRDIDPRPITSLHIAIGARKLHSRLTPVLIQAVFRIRDTLSTLKFWECSSVNEWNDDWTHHGLGLDAYESLFGACEWLQELECHLSIRDIIFGFFKLISINLSSLHIMRLHIYTTQTARALTDGGMTIRHCSATDIHDTQALAVIPEILIREGLQKDLLPHLKRRLRFSIIVHGLARSDEITLSTQWSVTLDGEADPVSGIYIHRKH